MLTDQDRVDIKDLVYEGTYIQNQMKLFGDPLKAKFDEYCQSHDMNVQEHRDEAYRIARAVGPTNSLRGNLFERIIRRVMLNIFDDTPFKVYKQVPYDHTKDDMLRCRRIDFVVAEEDTLKDQVDLSQAVVVSCKTSLGAHWREDEALYDKG